MIAGCFLTVAKVTAVVNGLSDEPMLAARAIYDLELVGSGARLEFKGLTGKQACGLNVGDRFDICLRSLDDNEFVAQRALATR